MNIFPGAASASCSIGFSWKDLISCGLKTLSPIFFFPLCCIVSRGWMSLPCFFVPLIAHWDFFKEMKGPHLSPKSVGHAPVPLLFRDRKFCRPRPAAPLVWSGPPLLFLFSAPPTNSRGARLFLRSSEIFCFGWKADAISPYAADLPTFQQLYPVSPPSHAQLSKKPHLQG